MNVFIIIAVSVFLAACTKEMPQSEPPDTESQQPERTDEWRSMYAGYLSENSGEDSYDGFYIGDINRDGVPELIVGDYNPPVLTNSGTICYLINGRLHTLDLWPISYWGMGGYLEDTNQLILLKWYGHTQGTFGSVDFFLYDWTPDGYIETYSLTRESGYGGSDDSREGITEAVYAQGYINGNEVEFDEFEAALEDMYELLAESTWFPMTDYNDVADISDYLSNWQEDSLLPPVCN